MTSTRSCCLSAVVIAVTLQIQVDGFVSTGGVVSGRNAVSMSSLTKGSSSPIQTPSRWSTTSFELSSSYAEYMATRERQATMAPAEKEKSLYEEYTRAKVSVPGASKPAPAAPAAPGPAPAPVAELSPYEEYMRSRSNIQAAEAKTTPAEKEKSSVYGDYMASRTEAEGVAPADCAEEECDADEVVEQAGLFASYMASRGIQVSTPAAPTAPAAAAAAPAKELTPYEEYMQSRQKVVQSGAGIKPEEIKQVSEFESYAQTRAKREAAEAAMPPAQRQAAIYDDYMQSSAPSKTAEGHIGTGGMADTRDPAPVDHEDPRKSISAAPTFAEYLKSKRN